MEYDLRYKMQHLGDYVTDAIEKVSDSAREYARGVILTYDIHELRKNKRCLAREIGERVVQVTKEGLTDIRKDDKLMGLFAELENIEKTLASYEKERDELATLYKPKLKPVEDASLGFVEEAGIGN